MSELQNRRYLLGYDPGNGDDLGCTVHGEIKGDVIYITKIEYDQKQADNQGEGGEND